MNLKVILLASFFISSVGHTFELKKVTEEEGFKMRSDCPLHISYGSYGSGTPRKIMEQIDALLKETSAVTSVSSWHWGMEGETDYCLHMDESDPQSIDELQQKLVEIIPLKSRHGYTTLNRKGKKIRQTTWPD